MELPTTESFSQLRELHTSGLISDAELRQWVMGGTLEEAEEAVAEIRAESARNGGSALDDLLGNLDAGGEE